MIAFVTGDILASDAEALVNTVNCVGIMGRGIALQFKKAFPDNFLAYAAACKRGEVLPGKMFICPTGGMGNPRYIVNFPTKRHWRGQSRIQDIDAGLIALVSEIRQLGIRSVAIPPLGSGLGGLNWHDVRPRIENALSNLPEVQATVFEPSGAPDPRSMVKATKVPSMTPGRAALVGLMQRYLSGLMDPSISLLEVHKLMYFLQEAGQPLRFRFVKATYGPYAENLRQPLNLIEGHLISGYADGGDAPDKQLELVPGAAEDAIAFLKQHSATLMRFDRVSNLVEGFETPFGLELLSTVHWLVKHEGADTVEKAEAATYAWGERKRRFSPEQIQLAWRTLESKGWFAPHSFVLSPQGEGAGN